MKNEKRGPSLLSAIAGVTVNLMQVIEKHIRKRSNAKKEGKARKRITLQTREERSEGYQRGRVPGTTVSDRKTKREDDMKLTETSKQHEEVKSGIEERLGERQEYVEDMLGQEVAWKSARLQKRTVNRLGSEEQQLYEMGQGRARRRR